MSDARLAPGTRRMVVLLRAICLLILALLALIAVLLVVSPATLLSDAGGVWPLARLPTGPWRVATLALALLLLVPPALAARALDRLGAAFLRGEVMAISSARHLATAGAALIATAALGLVARPLFDLMAGLDAGGGSVAISLGSHDLALLGGGLLLRTLGRVLADAAGLAEENRAFV